MKLVKVMTTMLLGGCVCAPSHATPPQALPASSAHESVGPTPLREMDEQMDRVFRDVLTLGKEFRRQSDHTLSELLMFHSASVQDDLLNALEELRELAFGTGNLLAQLIFDSTWGEEEIRSLRGGAAADDRLSRDFLVYDALGSPCAVAGSAFTALLTDSSQHRGATDPEAEKKIYAVLRILSKIRDVPAHSTLGLQKVKRIGDTIDFTSALLLLGKVAREDYKTLSLTRIADTTLPAARRKEYCARLKDLGGDASMEDSASQLSKPAEPHRLRELLPYAA